MNPVKTILYIALTIALVFQGMLLMAQAPEKISYQSVIRDATGELIRTKAVGVQISILKGSVAGTIVYVEVHTPITNINGLATMEVGVGTPVSGSFSAIDWSSGPYFLKVETDPVGGSTYTVTGSSEILSTPYALYAKEAETVEIETDPVYGESVAKGITASDTTIWNNKLDSYTETDPSVPAGTSLGQMQYWSGTAWVTVTQGSEGQVLMLNSGVPTWISLAGLKILGENDVYNPITNEIWMDRNLGATRVAMSSTDTASYGDLYQWGRVADGHQIRTSGTTFDLSSTDAPGHANFILAPSSPYDWRSPQNNNLWQGVNGVNNPCPSGYRLPTETELDAERASWSSNTSEGAFASPLKLPIAGLRLYNDGSLEGVDSNAYYWSSTIDGTNSSILIINSTDALMLNSNHAAGFSVRCIKD